MFAKASVYLDLDTFFNIKSFRLELEAKLNVTFFTERLQKNGTQKKGTRNISNGVLRVRTQGVYCKLNVPLKVDTLSL